MKKIKPTAQKTILAIPTPESPTTNRKSLGTFEDARKYLNVQGRALRQMIKDRETNGLKMIVRRIGNGRGIWRFDMDLLAKWETPESE